MNLKSANRTASIILAAGFLFGVIKVRSETFRVSSPQEIQAALGLVQPGDSLMMTNGVWYDARIVFTGQGTEAGPITLCAETPGHVILTGQSRLSIGGSYLIVSGLNWIYGYTLSEHVIEFRAGTQYAHHCRLTECSMTHYNPPDSGRDFKWVSLYGTHNRVDHCIFAHRNHAGVTLTVWLNGQPNDHLIDHNYFADRASGGGTNGYETIRIGTSDWSLSNSRTTVEYNLFERCDGEIEIISNKSCENIYRYNTFRDCEGTLTLRHGNRCRIEGNFFFGNMKDNSGGVRIIGEDHIVVNNYFEGVEGNGHRAAVSLVNGVPDSPLNRYFQVKNAVVAFNTFLNNRYDLCIGAGVSSEQSLPPLDCRIANNVVSGTVTRTIEQRDNPLGLVYEGNIFLTQNPGIPQQEGILLADPLLVRDAAGVWRPDPVKSPAVNSATGDYGWLTADVDGQPRSDGEPDAGCDEISDEGITNRPLSPGDVGPAWSGNTSLPAVLVWRTEGSGTIVLDPPGGTYSEGTKVILTAVPDLGWSFARWGGVLSGSENPVELVIEKTMNIVATFVQTTRVVGSGCEPDGYALNQNYPNPFNPRTTIFFTLKEAGNASLSIFDTAGRQMRYSFDQYLEGGSHSMTLDASEWPSGIYIARLRSGSFNAKIKMILSR